MQPVKGVLIDLGGVVYQGDDAIAGAPAAIERLRAANMPFRFLTNTTSQPARGILEKLASIGVPVSRAELFTPADAARAYAARHGLNAHPLVAPALLEDFAGLPGGSREAVVVGDARDGFTFSTLNDAFRRIWQGAELISLASNRYYADSDGQPSLDVGAFVAALEYAAGVKAMVLGKPSADFFRSAVADMGLHPSEVAMIGDDAEFDVAAAILAGLQGILVHTGKWTPETAQKIAPQPTHERADLNEAVSLLLD
ncbi:MAG: TIGR01458 family HAD-type hydrolase [Hyphomicrobiaceae bacterium]|nr:TIGR01458 family HAD-type hydrolase [Hyphomicrobiaceae bacterium]